MTQRTVACMTLGCKVNQYDSEIMLERLIEKGFRVVPFEEMADVYIINTCVVTQTGEKKSRQMIRRAIKQNPCADIVVCGCLAQKDAEKLLESGARLVIGNQRRNEIYELLERAKDEGLCLIAVEDIKKVPFEDAQINNHIGHTRAIMKIQEGCDRFCTYCIIPYVRGNIRSKSIESIEKEAFSLSKAGFLEVVLTGIHLTSYGRDLNGESLADAIEAVARQEGIRRIRLGSLEPVIINEQFVERISRIKKLCPQFHLSLQSGSDKVLKKMARRYSTEEFRQAVKLLREKFPLCAISTDIIAGFPGEGEQEHLESLKFAEEIGFSKSHIFPYSIRSGTRAANFPEQNTRQTKEKRAHEHIMLAQKSQQKYAESLLFTVQEVLFEEEDEQGATGYTPQYMSVYMQGARSGEIIKLLLSQYSNEQFLGERL